MATLYVWQAYELTVDGEQLKGGSRSAPVELTVDGKRKEWYRSLADSTAATVWNGTSTDEPISNFDFLYVESDQNLRLELTVDVGSEVGDEKIVLEVQANKPFMLLSDDAFAAYSSISSATEDVIDKVAVRTESGQAANVRVLLVT
jgi:hypothetical protein